MCRLTEFVVKYALIISNSIFSILGLAIAAIGIYLIVQLGDILELIPVNINAVPITITVLGCAIFVTGYLGCCGAVKQSKCMLICYGIIMGALAVGKVYLTVVVFDFMDTVQTTVTGWIMSAFTNQNLRPAYNVMEHLFSCCGTTGAGSYSPNPIPETCCANPVNGQCSLQGSYSGCTDRMVDFFQTYAEAIGSVLVVIIIVEIVAVACALFLLCCGRQNQRSKNLA